LFIRQSNYAGRVARRNQKRTPKAYIIASARFPGDNVALEVKRARGEEDDVMKQKLAKEELAQLNAKFQGIVLSPSGQEVVDLTQA
jgi:hypothetical protein